jgi:hypothetical protein
MNGNEVNNKGGNTAPRAGRVISGGGVILSEEGKLWAELIHMCMN